MPTEFDLTAHDLITHLGLEAGRIMEDRSVELALKLPDKKDVQSERLDRAHRAGRDIVALVAAAQALQRRYQFDPA